MSTKMVVERMYRSHRERLKHADTVLDTHVHIPDFLKPENQAWRKTEDERRKKILTLNNEHFYKRLAVAENQMSIYTVDNIRHLEVLNVMKKHRGRVILQARARKSIKIKQENDFNQGRLDNARPTTSNEGLMEWYKLHSNFKEGRLVSDRRTTCETANGCHVQLLIDSMLTSIPLVFLSFPFVVRSCALSSLFVLAQAG